ncbi:MAG TPA: cyclodeaminase/cyclohydrolase family protein [Thermomicrobiales bacterium]|nr:cyclodeaminase/cyclohydrolase family protein [Thermomicrobiales bacterium]
MTAPTPLSDRTIGYYLDTLGSAAPAPGGGSVTGVMGALAAALGQMVLNVTMKGATDPGLESQVSGLGERMREFISGAEADEAAYGGYVAATQLPKGTTEEKATRRAALQEALHASARAPLAVAINATGLLADLVSVIERGATNILSDAEIAILLAEATVSASLINLRINLPLIRDASVAAALAAEGNHLEELARAHAQQCRNALAARRTP